MQEITKGAREVYERGVGYFQQNSQTTNPWFKQIVFFLSEMAYHWHGRTG